MKYCIYGKMPELLIKSVKILFFGAIAGTSGDSETVMVERGVVVDNCFSGGVSVSITAFSPEILLTTVFPAGGGVTISTLKTMESEPESGGIGGEGVGLIERTVMKMVLSSVSDPSDTVNVIW